MRILLAPNAFKNSLSADRVARALAEGLKASSLEAELIVFPIGDGGDGTVQLLNAHIGLASVEVQTVDPMGRPLRVSYGFQEEGAVAYIELAAASGLHLLAEQERNPMQASTYGTGLLMLDALEKGAKHLVMSVGGSATVDGGCGLLAAMGAQFKDGNGAPLSVCPESLLNLEEIDLSRLDTRLSGCEITVLCDVRNPLIGKKGAAFVFGPQKGASADQVEYLDDFLERLNNCWIRQFNKDAISIRGGGAAGGVAAGLWAMAGAELVSGIDYFLDLTRFNEALKGADLLITGEGSIDDQTLEGKGPAGVARRAKERGVRVLGIAGNIPLSKGGALRSYFDELMSIGNQISTLKEAQQSTYENLTRTGRLIGELISWGGFKTKK